MRGLILVFFDSAEAARISGAGLDAWGRNVRSAQGPRSPPVSIVRLHLPADGRAAANRRPLRASRAGGLKAVRARARVLPAPDGDPQCSARRSGHEPIST